MEAPAARAGRCNFRWVIPITAEERAYAAERGLDALEQRFEEAGLEYWDPHRASVIP